jgi:hypothetical protein
MRNHTLLPGLARKPIYLQHYSDPLLYCNAPLIEISMKTNWFSQKPVKLVQISFVGLQKKWMV